ncbi:MAG TPA: O-antigen ligase family protein [Flavitalea sp.]|nr:O-antigen ligase family protein [Flavitalea sp.]
MKAPRHLEVLGILCIFSVFLDRAIRGVLPFDLYLNYPIFIVFMLAVIAHLGGLVFPPRWFNWSLAAIFIVSLINLLFTGRLGFEFVKQVFGIVFTSFVYYNVLYIFKFDIKRIFNYYLKFAYWVAAFGVVDNILHIVGFHLTAVNSAGPFLYREYSIMGEPFYLAMALTPAVVYYCVFFHRTWQNEKWKFLCILLCYLLTFSSIALTGLILGVFFGLYQNQFFSLRSNRLAIVPVLIIPVIFFANSLIQNVNLYKARFNDTFTLFFTTQVKTEEAGKSNASTFALYSNYVIARDSFFEDPLFGSGLGSHPIIYKETFLKYFPEKYLQMFGNQNQQDANSKLLRLMSETGLFGTVLFLAAVFGFRLANKYSHSVLEYTAINNSIFVYIILGLIRNGNYINVGFFLFFFMYYIAYKNVKQSTLSDSRF